MKVRPAIVRVPERIPVPVNASIVKAMDALALPEILAGATCRKLSFEFALHEERVSR